MSTYKGGGPKNRATMDPTLDTFFKLLCSVLPTLVSTLNLRRSQPKGATYHPELFTFFHQNKLSPPVSTPFPKSLPRDPSLKNFVIRKTQAFDFQPTDELPPPSMNEFLDVKRPPRLFEYRPGQSLNLGIKFTASILQQGVRHASISRCCAGCVLETTTNFLALHSLHLLMISPPSSAGLHRQFVRVMLLIVIDLRAVFSPLLPPGLIWVSPLSPRVGKSLVPQCFMASPGKHTDSRRVLSLSCDCFNHSLPFSTIVADLFRTPG